MVRRPRTAPATASSGMDYEPPRFLRLIRYGLMFTVVVAVAAIIYTVLWFVGASQLKASVQDWMATRPGTGLNATIERLEIGGFPFTFRLIAAKPVIRFSPPVASSQASWSFRVDQAIARVSPLRRQTVGIELSGSHGVEIGAGGRKRIFQGNNGWLAGSATLDDEGFPEALSLEAGDLNLKVENDQTAYAVQSMRLSAERRNGDQLSPEIGLTLRAEGIDAPALVPLPLGNSIERLILEAKLVGDLPLENILGNLTRWRDDGGTLELTTFDMRYGQLGIQANGTLALDRELQPMGALTARLEGFFGAIDALRRANVIRTRDAAMAKLVLGSLARRSPGGGPRAISLPLSIQDRRLSAGPVPLLEIPPIPWPVQAGDNNRLRIIR